MKKLLVLIAALMATTATAGSPGSHVQYVAQKMRYDIWIEACLYTKYDCTGVAVPKVQFKKLRQGLYGYYDGSDTVYVSSAVSRLQKKATLYHEMIHYLQVQKGGLRVPGPAKEICAAEAEAFAEGDKRWDRLGKPSKKRGPNWWLPYQHCWKYYE